MGGTHLTVISTEVSEANEAEKSLTNRTFCIVKDFSTALEMSSQMLRECLVCGLYRLFGTPTRIVTINFARD